ncbi:hypothetical protein [Methylocystis silviterrae]
MRVLTTNARAGAFSLGPVLMALLRGKAQRPRVNGGKRDDQSCRRISLP